MAQKYALVWKVFFQQNGQEENVNIDAIILDEPSWYIIAATETQDPETWLAYAQDRKMGDSRYSIMAFRRDIRLAKLNESIIQAREARVLNDDLCRVDSWTCPWLRLACIRTGIPTTTPECGRCDLGGVRDADQRAEENRHVSVSGTVEGVRTRQEIQASGKTPA
jgi:hypothetical protein